ncbi:MAG: FAD-binding oxidoreductase [Dehalococcoidia bacterium]
MDSADVVVIGGGVSGLSSAYFLAKRGMRVVVVEKGVVGSEASGRNGGLIIQRIGDPRLVPIDVESIRVWRTLDEELGYPTEFVGDGGLMIALTEEDLADAYQMRDDYHKHGLRAEVVDSREVKEMIRGVSDRTLGGLFYPDGAHGNPQRTVQAFAWAFQGKGGTLCQRTAVTGITVTGSKVSSVETTAGSIKTDFVVSAAGPQTGLIGDLVGLRIPVAPSRIESIATVPLEPLFKVHLIANGLYGRQSLRGNLLFGGGSLEFGDVALAKEPAKPNSPLIRNISRRLAELIPGVEDVRVLRAWAGIVEVTPDGQPIIDMLDYPEGFVVVSQSAHGFALCPGTGVVVSQLIVDGESPIDISGLKLRRFDWLDRDWRREWKFMPGDYSA